MIAIVDTGGANIASIQNALTRLGVSSLVTGDVIKLQEATHLILPGVGHAKYAMERLESLELKSFLRATKKPVLGICLGMQLLFSYLEEGNVEGLGILPGTVKALTPSSTFRVPHMGWNALRTKKQSRLLAGLPSDASFYFVHSYKAPEGEFICAMNDSPESIPAIVEYKNFFATQFHPEKSGDAGAQILKNFLNLTESSSDDTLPRH